VQGETIMETQYYCSTCRKMVKEGHKHKPVKSMAAFAGDYEDSKIIHSYRIR
jgi:hypothetical protein